MASAKHCRRSGWGLKLTQLAALWALCCAPLAAWAGTLRITSGDTTVYVALDGENRGVTPIELPEVSAGPHVLGFRAAMFGPLAFTQKIDLAETGGLEVVVDFPNRLATVKVMQGVVAQPQTPSQVWGVTPAAVPAATTGSLEVTSDIPDAAIFLDGQDTGRTTPATLEGLPAGSHQLRVRTDCAQAEANLTVEAGKTVSSNLQLVAGTGILEIASTPPGAMVLVDGVMAGSSPIALDDVACGEHTVDIRAPGYLQDTRSLMVPAYERSAIQAELVEEAYGGLVVTPTPEGMEVFINGQLAGAGPMSIAEIGTGSYELKVSLPGYEDWSQTVEVKADEVAEVNVALFPAKPTAGPLPVRRVVLNTAVTGLGVGLGIWAINARADTSEAQFYYDNKQFSTSAEADAYYREEVVPRKAITWGTGLSSAALMLASGPLWATTRRPCAIGAGPGAVSFFARW